MFQKRDKLIFSRFFYHGGSHSAGRLAVPSEGTRDLLQNKGEADSAFLVLFHFLPQYRVCLLTGIRLLFCSDLSL
jgi:hypothetical protein